MEIKNNTSQSFLLVNGQTLNSYSILKVDPSDQSLMEQLNNLSNKGIISFL